MQTAYGVSVHPRSTAPSSSWRAMTYAAGPAPVRPASEHLHRPPEAHEGGPPASIPMNGADDERAPACLTVDFALTYFLVSGEMERTKVPCEPADHRRLRYVRSDRLGRRQVLRLLRQEVLRRERTSTSKIKSRTLIIPGKVAVMKGEIQEKLPGWRVVVGPTRGCSCCQNILKDEEYLRPALKRPTPRAAAAAARGGSRLPWKRMRL